MNRRTFLKFMVLGGLVSSLAKKFRLAGGAKKAMFWKRVN